MKYAACLLIVLALAIAVTGCSATQQGCSVVACRVSPRGAFGGADSAAPRGHGDVTISSLPQIAPAEVIR